MKRIIKQVFCRHKHTKHVQITQHIDKGKTYMFYGTECKRCGKTRWWM